MSYICLCHILGISAKLLTASPVEAPGHGAPSLATIWEAYRYRNVHMHIIAMVIKIERIAITIIITLIITIIITIYIYISD